MLFDFIIIGSGLAGLTSALILKDVGEVLLVSKGSLSDCATDLAQGGIAAVVEKKDSFESHIKDTLVAGCYHNNKKAVEYMVKNAPLAIKWLVSQGVHFDKKNGGFAPTREAAHSYCRVLHATDFTGKEIEKALVKQVENSEKIKIWEHCFAIDLLVQNRACFGVQAIKDDKVINLFGRAVILATGGLGQFYQWTTNPVQATGDGLAMAYRVGAKLSDLEFIQFHPTAFKNQKSPLFLLSESLRGEGAYLVKFKVQSSKFKVNKKEESFMQKYDMRGELAPRDIVARAIYQEQQEGYEIYLDIRHKGKDFIKKRFPNIFRETKKRGFDLTTDLVPVTPAVHYSCGGVTTDLYGRTNIANLFAFGETSCTGVHGANRLASNSLLEAVVFPLRLRHLKGGRMQTDKDSFQVEKSAIKEGNKKESGISELFEVTKIRYNLQKLMWNNVGIIRSRQGLKQAKEQIIKWETELKREGYSRELIELRNMLLVAKLVTAAALRRKQSLGAHFVE